MDSNLIQSIRDKYSFTTKQINAVLSLLEDKIVREIELVIIRIIGANGVKNKPRNESYSHAHWSLYTFQIARIG